ncbi:MAG: endonuclease domain-containing protein [archaeon]|nr:endonuclease domain-containing protein [archaeon]
MEALKLIEYRTCIDCGLSKELSYFLRTHGKSKSSYQERCRDCKNTIRRNKKTYRTHKICQVCKAEKPLSDFNKTRANIYNYRCNQCIEEIKKKRLTKEYKKEKRIKYKESHKRVHKNYMERKKLKRLKEEIEQNKTLYHNILIDRSQKATYDDICISYQISKRFLKRIIKYEGNCYKKETVIDRIQPILNKYLNSYSVREHTWSWLKSPQTNCALRVDLFYPELNLVIEYNGPQHYREIGYKNLEIVQLRDKAKYQLLEQYGIKCVIFTSEDEINEEIKES